MKELIRKILTKEVILYIAFGILTTIVNLGSFYVMNSILQWNENISNFIAILLAVIFAYITNKIWVFCSKTDSKMDLLREIGSFFGARVFTLIFETIFLIIVIDKLHFNTMLMKIVSNILVILMNFVFSKIFIFKKKGN